MLQVWFPSNRDHWLGTPNRKGRKPGSFPAGHNNRFHGGLLQLLSAKLIICEGGAADAAPPSIVQHGIKVLQVSIFTNHLTGHAQQANVQSDGNSLSVWLVAYHTVLAVQSACWPLPL